MKYQRKQPNRKPFSEETRERMAAAKRGRTITQEHKDSLRKSMEIRHKKVNFLMDLFEDYSLEQLDSPLFDIHIEFIPKAVTIRNKFNGDAIDTNGLFL